MGASTGIFNKSEVAVMVAIVLLTTLLTPLGLRAAFQMKGDDDEEELTDGVNQMSAVASPEIRAPEVPSGEEVAEGVPEPESRVSLHCNGLQIAIAQDQ
jgi:hypothetical protein